MRRLLADGAHERHLECLKGLMNHTVRRRCSETAATELLPERWVTKAHSKPADLPRQPRKNS